MDTQREALERRRQREGLPEGGTWNYSLEHDEWLYRWDNPDGGWTVYIPPRRRKAPD